MWSEIRRLRSLPKRDFHNRFPRTVSAGPMLVRNPIYLGMFGMLVATALVFSRWWMLCIGVAVFLIGNSIRIKSEEQLLRESFGQQFEDYARRVPAMFPRVL